MMNGNFRESPFPLEGGRAGDGGGSASGLGAAAASRPNEHLSAGRQGATPNPDPSPLQGEGERLAHGPTKGGIGRARHLRQNMPLAERLLWAELRKLKLNIRRQAPIGRSVVDFACHASRLVIEVDGPVHDEPERAVRDLERTAWLNEQGYRVIRFPEKNVRDHLNKVVQRIAAEAAPPPSPTLPPSRGKGDPRYLVR